MAKIAWAQGLISKLVDWFTRKRNLGLSLIRYSIFGLVTLAAGDFVFEMQGIAGGLGEFKFSTGGGLQGVLLSIGFCALLGTTALGTLMVAVSWFQELREATVNRILVVEMRGLEDTTDHPLIKALPPSLPPSQADLWTVWSTSVRC